MKTRRLLLGTVVLAALATVGTSGTSNDAKKGNTIGHQLDGQNVLVLDNHVEDGNVHIAPAEGTTTLLSDQAYVGKAKIGDAVNMVEEILAAGLLNEEEARRTMDQLTSVARGIAVDRIPDELLAAGADPNKVPLDLIPVPLDLDFLIKLAAEGDGYLIVESLLAVEEADQQWLAGAHSQAVGTYEYACSVLLVPTDCSDDTASEGSITVSPMLAPTSHRDSLLVHDPDTMGGTTAAAKKR